MLDEDLKLIPLDIQKRILELQSMNTVDEKISWQSLKYFYEFLLDNPNIERPAITTTPDGNIYIEWRKNNICLFGIEFLENGHIKCAVIMEGK